MKKNTIYILLLLCYLTNIKSQVTLPLHDFFQLPGWQDNGSIKPVIHPLSLQQKDSLLLFSVTQKKSGNTNWFIRKLQNEHFATVRTPDFELNISPLFILDLGKDSEQDNYIYRNTRGIFLEATLRNKIGFWSTFHENQSRLPHHVAQFSDFYGIIPGQGLHKPFNETGYDFAWSEAMVYFTLFQKLSVQFGQGKRFVGNGYRSMLYSDNSFSYPHLALQFNHQKFQYATWFTSFMNPDLPDPSIIINHHWQRKAGVFHYLTYSISEQLELGLFEGNIISSRTAKGKYEFNAAHYNPIIFINGFDQKIHNITGLNAHFNYQDFMLYGQYVVNPLDTRKWGMQTGIKYDHISATNRYYALAEWNKSEKGLYTFSDTILSYTHFSQPLAHPLGENFSEFVFKATVRRKRFESSYKFNYALSSSDTTGYLPGLNLFLPSDQQLETKDHTTRNIHEFSVSYILNPQYNMRFTVGALLRNFNYNGNETKSSYVYVSFRTVIFARYYDF